MSISISLVYTSCSASSDIDVKKGRGLEDIMAEEILLGIMAISFEFYSILL
jgi:hypothetical protein